MAKTAGGIPDQRRGLFGARALRATKAKEQINAPRRRYNIRMTQVWSLLPTRDVNIVDYTYYDKLRRGLVLGAEVSGLFVKPITSKLASYMFGDLPGVDLPLNDGVVPAESVAAQIERLSSAVNRWFGERHARVLMAVQDALDLGDAYLIFNGDGTLTVVPPHVVTPIVNPDDVSEWIGWRVRERFEDPTKIGVWQTIEDEYYADRRVRTVSRVALSRTGLTTTPTSAPQIFPNPLGMVPVVHVKNQFGSDEMFGRPELQAAITWLMRYGAVLDAGLTGNLRQGRPIPKIEGLGTVEDIERFWEAHGGRETQTLGDGTTETTTTINFDADQFITLPTGATFSFAAPAPFAGETEKFLGLLFWILIQHSEIPEYAMGTAIASSKASAETQSDPFERFIRKKQMMATDWFLHLVRLAMAYQAILTNTTRVLSLVRPALDWKPVSKEDRALVLQAIDLARREGVLDDVTMLSILRWIGIKDPAWVLEKARQEAADRQEQFDAAANAIDRMANAPDPADDDEDATDDPSGQGGAR